MITPRGPGQKRHRTQLPWAGTTLVLDSRRPRVPSIIKITDGVYCAHDYAFANIGFVVTAESVVVIDTSESLPAARAVLHEIRRISPLPISHLIYTHHHGDHTRAAKVFRTPATKIVAQQLLPEEIVKKDLFLPYRQRVSAHHFAAAPDSALAPVACDAMGPEEIDAGYLPPDITFDHKYGFEEGGVAIHLFHTPGETVDHAAVWLPQKRVLFPADLFYAYFPMLSSPMKPNRPVTAWADSIERLCALHAEYLAPSHGTPIAGAAQIEEMLANYSRAIRHVHDETVRCINAGKTVEEAIREVKLPESLARLPYLRQKYGKVSWAVRGLFRQYTGWYSFNPTELDARPEPLRHRTLLRVCGGAAPLIQRARKAWYEKDYQLVLELTEIVLNVQPDHPRAARLRLAALENLAAQSNNNVERNLYRNSAKHARATLRSRQRNRGERALSGVKKDTMRLGHR
jgi:alkyl sulfatase BDS1-like metallo-beta-lactamase superfamily hydrolase